VAEVDAETGFVKILRWISSEDCGTAINPTVVEGQIAGGLAQAIGMVLLEEMAFDARGNPTVATYKDYLLPAMSDIPDFEFLHANTPSKSVGGMRGVGEGGAIIGSPTLINAIADALAPFGEVPVELPLTPAKLLSVIEGRNIAGAAHHAKPSAARESAVAGAGIEDPSPHAAADSPLSAELARAAAPAEALIDGDWNMVLATPMGPKEMRGHFETEGQSLSGYLSSPEGQQAFTGTVEGNRLKFDLKVDKPMKITLKYDIAMEGGRLAGKVKMGIFGSAKLTGDRA
jgi:carbon-monoxide dehydrogenase large subunit